MGFMFHLEDENIFTCVFFVAFRQLTEALQADEQAGEVPVGIVDVTKNIRQPPAATELDDGSFRKDILLFMI